MLLPALRTGLLATVVFLHADESGCGSDEHEHDLDLAGADLANGQVIHDGTCNIVGCHAANPELAANVPLHTNSELFDIIDQGTDDMPAQGQLSDDDLIDVIAYLREIYD